MTGFSLIGAGNTAQLALDGKLVTLGTLTLLGYHVTKSPENNGKGEFCYRCAPQGTGILRAWYQVSITCNGVHGAVWICSHCSTAHQHQSCGQSIWAELTKENKSLYSSGVPGVDNVMGAGGRPGERVSLCSSAESDVGNEKPRIYSENDNDNKGIGRFILEVLFKYPDLTAADISEKLASEHKVTVFRSYINSLLYGELKRCVTKDAHFRWRLIEAHPGHKQAATVAKEEEVFVKYESTFNYETFLASNKPHYLITDDQFYKWLSSVKQSSLKSSTIGALAAKLSLPCPEAKRAEVISEYVDISLVDLYEMEDSQFRRTLLLIIAAVANDLLNESDSIGNKNQRYPLVSSTNSDRFTSLAEDDSVTEALIVTRFKDGRESAIGLATRFGKTAPEIISLLQKRGYLSETQLSADDGDGDGIPALFLAILRLYGISFQQWCLSFSTTVETARRALKQFLSRDVISSSGLKVIHCIKSELPELYSRLAEQRSEERPKPGLVQVAREVSKNEHMTLESHIAQLFSEGNGIVSISRQLGVTAILVFSTLVRAKIVKRKPGSAYNIAKIPHALRNRLKLDTINFGIWCDSMAVSPTIALKAINAFEASKEVPESGQVVIEMLKQEYPEMYHAMLVPWGKGDIDESPSGLTVAVGKPEEADEIKYAVTAFLRRLKLAVMPTDLLDDDLWKTWTSTLVDAGFAEKYVAAEAKKRGFFWSSSKDEERFDRYLYLPLPHLTHGTLRLEVKRTVTLCVAYAASEHLSGRDFCGQLLEDAPTEAAIPEVQQSGAISFDMIFQAENPAELLCPGIWDLWKKNIIRYDKESTRIADLVDELGVLYWQARWGKETLGDYLNFNLADFKTIQYPGKARTVLISFAKVGTDLARRVVGASGHHANQGCDVRVATMPLTQQAKALGIPAAQKESARDLRQVPHMTPSEHQRPQQGAFDRKEVPWKASLLDEILDDYF